MCAAVPGGEEDPECEESTEDSVTLCWRPPLYDGGKPIIDYVIEIREIGTQMWTPYVLPLNTSILDANLSFRFYPASSY